jgi:hypothetical protein
MNINCYIAKRAIFVESGQMCLAMVVDATYSSEEFTAIFEADDSPSLSCELKVIRRYDEDAVIAWSESAVFGARWNISVSSKEFYPEEDFWQANFLFGGGFRIFFNPIFIERFIGRDVTWLDEYFNAQNEDSADDDECSEISS